MTVIPVFNALERFSSISKEAIKSTFSDLYNIDSFISLLGSMGNLAGISVDAEKIFFGKDHWLFLGEGFNHAISKKINGTANYHEAIANTLKSINGWEKLAKENKTKNFYILIGPDKDSIYRDKLPGWYRQTDDSITKQLISSSNVYIDTLSLLTEQRKKSALPVYFKTDTHWNELGASAAFKGLVEKSHQNNDKLAWPEDELKFEEIKAEPGDLSRFQRSGYQLQDSDIKIISPSVTKIPVVVKSYKTGSILYSGINKIIESPKESLLIDSPKALNKAKVLWLRDSFGTALSRLMATTFTETLQVHHGRTTPEQIKEILLNYKPDYVIITVVERDELSNMFAYEPTSPPE